MIKPIKVLSIMMGAERVPGACEIYRITLPFHYMGQQSGWDTEWVYFQTIWQEFQAYGDEVFAHLYDYDIIVLPRALAPDEPSRMAMGILITSLRSHGVKVVYEVDDDYSNEFREVTEGGDAMSLMAMADAVTVTTPFLRDRMRKFTSQPIHILPNCVDPVLWRDAPVTIEKKDPNQVVIGLTGSATHKEDWKVLETVLPEIMATHDNAHLIIMGYHPEYLSDLPNTSYLPGHAYNLYCQIIRGCDIIIAPVVPDDGFNLAKSPIKVVEGQSARRTLSGGRNGGAAVIATDNPVYRLAVQNNVTGLLVEHTPQAWATALHSLVTDTDLRERLQVQGHKAVYKRFDISREHTQWARAYRKILSSPPNPASIPL